MTLNDQKHEMNISYKKESTNMMNLNRLVRSPSAGMLLSLLFVAMISGCGNDNSTGPTGGTPDTTPPIVLYTNPINGTTGVALINVTFSEPMNASSINSTSFTVSGPGATAVGGTVAYDAAHNRASFVPSNTLALATAFTATIMATVEDQSGNALTSNYMWHFTSAAGATVQLPVALLSSVDYAVLAGSTISNTGATTVTGDLGLSPGSSVTGFPPGIIVGTRHVGDPSSVQAKLDLTTA